MFRLFIHCILCLNECHTCCSYVIIHHLRSNQLFIHHQHSELGKIQTSNFCVQLRKFFKSQCRLTAQWDPSTETTHQRLMDQYQHINDIYLLFLNLTQSIQLSKHLHPTSPTFQIATFIKIIVITT